MDIETYLASTQAREDAARAATVDWSDESWVELPAGRRYQIHPLLPHPCRSGVWLRLAILDCENRDDPSEPIFVLRADTGFIVSDLGLGFRAYAIRTGDIDHKQLPGQPGDTGVAEYGGRIFACRIRGDSVCLAIKPDDLPDAICRVLLASIRLASKA